jgi:serine/threonine protein kinase
MASESKLDRLLSRWEMLREQGTTVHAEDLASDCPELLEPLRARIEALNAVDRMLSTSAQPTSSSDTAAPPSAQEPPPAPVPTVPGYEILGELGQGGMAVVYKARQTALKRLVALKVIFLACLRDSKEFIRFRQEAEVTALLRHPHIVQIHDILEHEGRLHLALEYMDGGTLADRLARKLPHPGVAAEMVETLARAVHFAHQHGVIHRDLKPSNILLQRVNRRATEIRRSQEHELAANQMSSLGASGFAYVDLFAKVADFGLAKRLDGSADHTPAGLVQGTPNYMPAEQALGKNENLGPAVDIYALGAILYECLTRRPPFVGTNILDTLVQVRTREPVAPRILQPGVPRDLETITLKCLEKEPQRRYPTAQALADDLHRFLRHEPITARRIGLLGRLWRWCRRSPSLAALIVVSLAAIVTVLAVVLLADRELKKQLAATRQAEEVAHLAEKELRRTLTRQVADRLEGDLRQFAEVCEASADLLEQRQNWTEAELKKWMESVLRSRPRIFGMCVALEPKQLGLGRQDFALYVYRKEGGGFQTKQLVPPVYQGDYRHKEWYARPRRENRGCWSEPYEAEGAEKTAMVTYSAPLFHQGQFVGVVTLDLALDFFAKLRKELDNLQLGRDGGHFLLSRKGIIISHSQDEFVFPSKQDCLSRLDVDPRLRQLLQDMQEQETGAGEATDFSTGREAIFLCARVPSAGWTFVVFIPQRKETGRQPPR